MQGSNSKKTTHAPVRLSAYDIRDEMYADLKKYLKIPLDQVSVQDTADIKEKLSQFLVGDYLLQPHDPDYPRKMNLTELQLRALSLENNSIWDLPPADRARGHTLLEPYVKEALEILEKAKSTFVNKYRVDHAHDESEQHSWGSMVGLSKKPEISPKKLAKNAEDNWHDKLMSETCNLIGEGRGRGGD
jgi:hypothetical protein